MDTFLLQYRNAKHAATNNSPAILFKGRSLRSFGNLDTTTVTFYKGNDQSLAHGIIVGQRGNRMVNVMDLQDGEIHVRHQDQIRISTESEEKNQMDDDEQSKQRNESLPTPGWHERSQKLPNI